MSRQGPASCRVAIACGGTGGHLFPGLAVADKLTARGCAVTLLISNKEVDRLAVKAVTGMEVVGLPAVGLRPGAGWSFLRGLVKSYGQSRELFRARPPRLALAMGGFTSAAPIVAAKRFGARTFLHESNTIPGRANRWLSWLADGAFVAFESAVERLHTRNVAVTGTPVRPEFQRRDERECRRAFGLDPEHPVVLIMGGSQGAAGIDKLVRTALPALCAALPECQWLHVSRTANISDLQAAYRAVGARAVVLSFCDHMHLGLGAARVAISRAGASSLAELAAMQVPPILIPYPAATENHQLINARAFEAAGAARVLEEQGVLPEALMRLLVQLVRDTPLRKQMQAALAGWHRASAADEIANAMLAGVLPVQAPAGERLAQPNEPGGTASVFGVALREGS